MRPSYGLLILIYLDSVLEFNVPQVIPMYSARFSLTVDPEVHAE